MLRAGEIVFGQAPFGVGCPGGGKPAGLAAIVVDAIVPAVHQITGERELAVEAVLGAGPEMEVRNGPGEQQATRVIPVVLAFDDLGAGRGDELADVDLQFLADEIFEIPFFEVLIEV